MVAVWDQELEVRKLVPDEFLTGGIIVASEQWQQCHLSAQYAIRLARFDVFDVVLFKSDAFDVPSFSLMTT